MKLVFLLIVFECMIALKTRVEAQGCVAQLAPIPTLMTLACSSVTADFTVTSLSPRYGFREGPLCKAKRELRSRLMMAMVWLFQLFKHTLRHSKPELHLFDLAGGYSLVKDGAVDKSEIQHVEEYPFPLFDGAVGEPIVQDKLVT